MQAWVPPHQQHHHSQRTLAWEAKASRSPEASTAATSAAAAATGMMLSFCSTFFSTRTRSP